MMAIVIAKCHLPPWRWPSFTRIANPSSSLRGNTKLLGELAAAAEKFWKTYDPGDPRRAPAKEVVADWIAARGVASDRVAKFIAQLLRADSVPPGPLKK
jgi:hypothetical protein